MVAEWEDAYPSLRDYLAQPMIPSASEDDRRKYERGRHLFLKYFKQRADEVDVE